MKVSKRCCTNQPCSVPVDLIPFGGVFAFSARKYLKVRNSYRTCGDSSCSDAIALDNDQATFFEKGTVVVPVPNCEIVHD